MKKYEPVPFQPENPASYKKKRAGNQRNDLWASGKRDEVYRSLFENMLNGLAFCKMVFPEDGPPDFIYLEVNEAFGKLTGLKDVVGKKVSEVIPGIQAADPELFEIYGRVAMTGQPERFEAYVEALKMWFSISVYSPEKEYFVAVFDVVTERKEAESALRQSEERYRSLIDNLGVGISLINPKMEVLALNRKMREWFPSVDPHGKPICFQVFNDPPRSGVCTYCPVTQTLQDSQVHEAITETPSAKGVRNYRVVASPIFDDEGRVTSIIEIAEDLTEKQAAERERESLRAQLVQAQKMEAIGQLAGGIAHDFNNMLAVILSSSGLALQGLREEDPLYNDLVEIKNAAERSATLTRQLLAFSRKQVLQPALLNLNEVAAGLEKMLLRIIGEDIDFVQVLAPDLGLVKIDPSQLEQVILNLVVNARHAMPRGGKLTIETQNIELDEQYAAHHVTATPGSFVLLAVSDTGTGMTPEVQERIFEPFFTTKSKEKGTGLGLSTVYGIVNQSGGHIWVYSEPGKGTTFKIYLPQEQGVAVHLPAEASHPKPPVGTETILVVEDEDAVRNLVKRILSGAGYTVLTAANGGEGLHLCQQHQGEIHMVLTDVVMPQMSGRILAERLASFRPDLKVLFMSGYTDNAFLHQGTLEPGTHFIGKPFRAADLTRKVREVLDGE